jgi:hypothetical protein
MSLLGKTPTMSDLNKYYREFWKEQDELMSRRLADPVLLQAAKDEIYNYERRSVPVRFHKSFEEMLERADRIKQGVLIDRARRAGRAKKPDALQELIVSLLRRRPKLTAPLLLEALQSEQNRPIIVEIDEGVIHFIQPDGTEDGKLKRAKVSGLKDRLSRAKNRLNSR